jgi:hypothetical protein
VGVEQRIATHPFVAILKTGAVIDPAVDRTASSADLLLRGGVHDQWRPGTTFAAPDSSSERSYG